MLDIIRMGGSAGHEAMLSSYSRASARSKINGAQFDEFRACFAKHGARA